MSAARMASTRTPLASVAQISGVLAVLALPLVVTAATTAVAPAASSPRQETSAASPHLSSAAASAPSATLKRVDLNNAGKAELKTLPGIGEAEADRIIAKRPFNSKAGIVTDAGIPAGVYIAIKRQIFVGPVAKPTSKKLASNQ